METGRIQLGAKKGSGENSDQFPSQGFFYGGDLQKVVKCSGSFIRKNESNVSHKALPYSSPIRGLTTRPKSNPARQHLILQDNLCRRRQICRIVPLGSVVSPDIHEWDWLGYIIAGESCPPAPFQDNFLKISEKKVEQFAVKR